MNSGSDDVDKGLVEELQHYSKLLAEEREKLKKLRRKKNRTVSDVKDVYIVEEQSLIKENAKLRSAIRKLKHSLRSFQMDPCVIEFQNKVSAVRKEIATAESEVATLKLVAHQQKKGLNEMRAGERSVSAIRSRQYEDEMKIREEVRELTEELKRLEKKDIQLHARLADLQEQVMMKVREREVAALRQKKEGQLKRIAELQQLQDEITSHRNECFDEERRAVVQRTKAKERMKNEIEELRGILAERKEELSRLQLNNEEMSL